MMTSVRAHDWVLRSRDVEIYGDVLYLYAPEGSLRTDPDAWQALGQTLNALGEKLDQWERWRERPDRGHVDGAEAVRPDPESSIAPLSPNREAALPVAARGRKLTRRLPWWALPIGIALAAGTLWLVGSAAIGIVTEIIEWITGLFG